MVFARSDNLRAVDARWHRRRQDAREMAFSVDEFSDEDITKYDLDTAGISGRSNDRTYEWHRSIDTLNSNGTDVRELDDR